MSDNTNNINTCPHLNAPCKYDQKGEHPPTWRICTECDEQPKKNIMNLNHTQVIKILSDYNQWRRGAEMEQPDNKTIGKTIDKAIEILKHLEYVEPLIKIAEDALKKVKQYKDESNITKKSKPKDTPIKPCPFCGSKADYYQDGKHHIVHCTGDCLGENGELCSMDYTKEKAINAWNQRT